MKRQYSHTKAVASNSLSHRVDKVVIPHMQVNCGPFHRLTETRAWVSNYIHGFLYDDSSMPQTQEWFEVRYGWVISLYSPLLYLTVITHPLQWRHNDRDGVSNHQPHDCLLKRLFRRRSKKISKLRVVDPCVAGEFPHKGPATRKTSSWRSNLITIKFCRYQASTMFLVYAKYNCHWIDVTENKHVNWSISPEFHDRWSFHWMCGRLELTN